MDNSFWLWLIVAVVVVIAGGSLVLGRVRANNAKLFEKEVTPERAKAASGRLDEEQHREVHRQLARENLLGAAQAIRKATGQGTRDALLDAQALTRFPQVWSAPTADGPDAQGEGTGRPAAPSTSDTPASGTPQHGVTGRLTAGRADGPSADEARLVGGHTPELPQDSGADPADAGAWTDGAEDEDWVIPEGWDETYGGDEGGGERHMEFTHHDGTELRRFSTQDLPDAERDQLMSQLRDGQLGEAAKLIAAKIGLSEEEVENALRANHESGHDKVDGIAVRFDRGDGTAVEFSTQDLAEDERERFVSALREGDLVAAAQVVARHTGISPEQALGLLKAFRRGS